jgi:hypothetical protein
VSCNLMTRIELSFVRLPLPCGCVHNSSETLFSELSYMRVRYRQPRQGTSLPSWWGRLGEVYVRRAHWHGGERLRRDDYLLRRAGLLPPSPRHDSRQGGFGEGSQLFRGRIGCLPTRRSPHPPSPGRTAGREEMGRAGSGRRGRDRAVIDGASPSDSMPRRSSCPGFPSPWYWRAISARRNQRRSSS